MDRSTENTAGSQLGRRNAAWHKTDGRLCSPLLALATVGSRATHSLLRPAGDHPNDLRTSLRTSLRAQGPLAPTMPSAMSNTPTMPVRNRLVIPAWGHLTKIRGGGHPGLPMPPRLTSCARDPGRKLSWHALPGGLSRPSNNQHPGTSSLPSVLLLLR